MSTSQHPDDRPDRLDDNSLSSRFQRRLARLRENGPRDLWWQLLDVLEKHRTLRLSLYAAVILVLLGVVTTVWIHPWWRQRTSVAMARQWLDAGRLDQASKSIQEALKVAPKLPESWKLAADLARRLGNQESALTYSRQAADLAPANTGLVLAWASDALLAGHPDETDRALASLPPAQLAESSHGQRIAGELARRRLDLNAARTRFETALRLDGPGTAINEVPLGIILLKSRETALRNRGLDTLSRWAPDAEWGAPASRALLQDALERDDRPAMLAWAESLRGNPRCTVGDLPLCLQALSIADETRFASVLAGLQKDHAVNGPAIALLGGWLNQIGRSPEAIRWIDSLPPAITTQAPVVVIMSEALRQTRSWARLDAWVAAGRWNNDVAFVRILYAYLAALRLNRVPEAAALWRDLQSNAGAVAGRTLFAGQTLYAWNLRDDALKLLWVAAEQPGSAFESLGTLARHYQVQRDAPGQHQVFRRLRSLRANDPAIANNYAFFAALTGNDLIAAEKIARDNYRADTQNIAYRTTYAFVLFTLKRMAMAEDILNIRGIDWREYPGYAFTRGLLLAATQRKAEARPLLESIDTRELSRHEEDLVRNALK